MSSLVLRPLVFALMLGACASSAVTAEKRETNLISRAELEAAGSVTAYDAVLRLRPTFLRYRGPTSLINASARMHPVVFLNEVEYGDLESLRRLPASGVEEVRFYPGPEAVTRYGSSYGVGAIAVKARVR